jgi:thiamine-triphosphatase
MLLEVERKFCASAASLIARNAGLPPFRHLVEHPRATFKDIYYDNGLGSLRGQHIWLRQRNERWEAKFKAGGDYTNSRFTEVYGGERIAAEFARQGIKLSSKKGNNHRNNPSSFDQEFDLDPRIFSKVLPAQLRVFELTPIAEITTTRSSWTADRCFKIVVDETDFGHRVGEVELELEHEYRGAGDAAVVSEELMDQMDNRIEEFMAKYAWAFPTGDHKGKLSAYFEYQKAAGKK